MKSRLKKIISMVMVLSMAVVLSACGGKSDVKTVIVPTDAEENVFNGRYTNSADNSTWQFNANGTLLITNENDSTGQYDIVYKDNSMYLTNVDGASIEFYYTEHEDGTIDITINGENADTGTLTPIDDKDE